MNNLVLEKVSKNYKKKNVLSNISISFNSDDITCIVGKNGIGKTTLLKAIAGEIELNDGTILLNNKQISSKLNDVILIPDTILLPQSLSIIEVVEMFERRNKRYDRKYVEDYLDFLNIDLSQPIGILSKGNQEIIQLALLIANKPKFIIFDEPFAAVDITKRDFLYNKIIDLATDGTGIIITSHIVGEIQNLFTRVVLLESSNLYKDINIDDIYNQGYKDVNEYLKTHM